MSRRQLIPVVAALLCAARVSPAASPAEQAIRDIDAEWVRVAQAHSDDGATVSGAAAPTVPVAAIAPMSTTAVTPAQMPGADHGEVPANYQDTIRRYFDKVLKNPDSVRYREITAPQKGNTATMQGVFAAQNSYGAYGGNKTYVFLFRGEKIVSTVMPRPEDEVN